MGISQGTCHTNYSTAQDVCKRVCVCVFHPFNCKFCIFVALLFHCFIVVAMLLVIKTQFTCSAVGQEPFMQRHVALTAFAVKWVRVLVRAPSCVAANT